jgi:hypothetical protein
MASTFRFGTENISELGLMISDKLREYGITTESELVIHLNENEFKKVDEDLFYRNREDESEKFVPSEGEIDIAFEGANIIIRQK